MRAIEDQTFSGMTLSIDNKHFIRCKIKDCILAYSGEDFAFAETAFEGNVGFAFEGPATRTIQFLKMFNVSLAQLQSPGEPLKQPLPTKKDVH